MTENELLFNEENSGFWAEVILPLALPVIYTYSVPVALVYKASPGCRAEVVFGKTKKYAGVIRSLITTNPPYKTKEILNILDDEPLLYTEQLQLWKWISEYYMCSEGEVMAAALPANFKLSSETILIFNETIGDDFSNLSDDEFLVAEALLLKKQLQLTEVQQILDASHVYPVIKKLIEKNVCFIWEKLNDKYRIKKENYVFLNPAHNNDESLSKILNDWKGAPKQLDLLLAFLHLNKTEGEVTQTALLKKSGATAAQLKGLAEKNLLIVEKRAIDRIKYLPKTYRLISNLAKLNSNA